MFLFTNIFCRFPRIFTEKTRHWFWESGFLKPDPQNHPSKMNNLEFKDCICALAEKICTVKTFLRSWFPKKKSPTIPYIADYIPWAENFRMGYP